MEYVGERVLSRAKGGVGVVGVFGEFECFFVL